jgi:Xaa-Pro dipeptidase
LGVTVVSKVARKYFEDIVKKEWEDRRTRFRRAQDYVDNSEHDAVIVQGREAAEYFLGSGLLPFERPFFLVFYDQSKDRKPEVLFPKLEVNQVRKKVRYSGIEDIVANPVDYFDTPAREPRAFASCVAALVRGCNKIGVQPMPSEFLVDTEQLELGKGIVEALGETQFPNERISHSSLLSDLRRTKSEYEIDMIKQAASKAEEYASKTLKSFIVESGLAIASFTHTLFLPSIMSKLFPHREYPNLKDKIYVGAMSGPEIDPHTAPNYVGRFKRGLANQYYSCVSNAYCCAELERCVVIGEPEQEIVIAYDAVIKANNAALQMMKPGTSLDAIAQASVGILEKAGYASEESRLHRTGHGIGLGTHEGPYIAQGSKGELKLNDVVSCENGVYLEGYGQVRDSNTWLITEDGPVCLTPFNYVMDENLEFHVPEKKPLGQDGELMYAPISIEPNWLARTIGKVFDFYYKKPSRLQEEVNELIEEHLKQQPD